MSASNARRGVRAGYRSASHGGVWRWLACALLALAALESRAQTIDDVAVVPQGADTVVRITFNATVRFLRQQPADASTLHRITFDLVAADETIVNQTSEESKRLAAAGPVPEFTLTYAPVRGRRVRELTLQLRTPAAILARQGPSSRAIDIVFAGRGDQAPSKVGGAADLCVASRAGGGRAAAATDKRYAADPAARSCEPTRQSAARAVPIDRYEVFASNAVVDGVTVTEVNLGYFATAQAAEAVRQSALDRFPQASVLDLAKRRDEMIRSTAAATPAPPTAASRAGGSGIECSDDGRAGSTGAARDRGGTGGSCPGGHGRSREPRQGADGAGA